MRPSTNRHSPTAMVSLAVLSLATLSLTSGCSGQQASADKLPYRVIKNLSYIPGGSNKEQMLDLYLPDDQTDRQRNRQRTGESPRLIVWIHGGGWIEGNKSDTPAPDLLKDGFAVASINYRLSKEAKYPAQLDDCKAAIRWLRKHAAAYGYAPDRIGVFGVSAGGHLVAMLGITGDNPKEEGDEGVKGVSSTVQAVCDWCGPTDLTTICKQGGADNELDLNSPTGPVALLLGGLPDEKKVLAQKASPVAFVDSAKEVPPFLIMHGDNDKVVPLAQSKELYKKLEGAKIDVKLSIVPGGKHGFYSPATIGQVLKFFHEKLDS